MMLDDLFPYSEYKDSGLPYYGQIPTNWKVLRNGQIFSQRNQTGFPDLPILEVSLKTGVRVRDFENSKRKQIMNDLEKYKCAAKGDIAYNMMRMWQGAVGVAPVDGLISPAYVVASPFPGVDSRYYSYLFRTQNYMNEVNKYSRGIVSDRNRLYWDQFKQIPSLFPPSIEQKKIADFLDDHGRKVSRFVRVRRRQIDSLSELKQVFINEVVTKGLNPSVKMKPSGIDWIGNIPEHWDTKKLKTIVRNITQNTYDKSPNEIYVGLENIEGWTGRIINASTETVFDSQAKRFEINNILFGKLRPYLAKVAKMTGNGVCSGELLVLKSVDNKCLADYLSLVLRSKGFIDTVTSSTYGTKMPRAEWSFIGDLRLPIPSLDEQKAIVNKITNYSYVIDRCIEGLENQILLIREYRTRLISDVVTGNVDVREIKVKDVFEEEQDLELIDEETSDLNDEVSDLEECEV
jgi:type I restriction enzyme, S subunit